MKANPFETFAAEFEIRPFNQDFKTTITDFFNAVVKSILSYQPEFVGHLKGFCKGQGSDYFQISFVSIQTGVQVNGHWNHNPDSARLTLNLIVLGIEQSRIQEILNEIVLRDNFKRTFSYSKLVML